MKKLKLFPKTFLYTFLVMLFVTVAAHGLLYLLAPHMIVSTNSVLENGAVIESSISNFKSSPCFSGLQYNHSSWLFFVIFQSLDEPDSADFKDDRTDGKPG